MALFKLYCLVSLCTHLLYGLNLFQRFDRRAALMAPPGIALPFGALPPPPVAEQWLQARRSQRDSETAKGVVLTLTVLFAGFFVAPLFLKPAPGWWTFGIAVLAVGLVAACMMPFSVVLLHFWFQPDTQQYFGRSKVTASASP